MSQAEKQALALRDLAVQVATAKGVKGRDLFSYADARLGINYYTASPYTLNVWKISETETKVLTLDEAVTAMRRRRIVGSRSALSRFFIRHDITFKKKPAGRGAGSARRRPRAKTLDSRARHA